MPEITAPMKEVRTCAPSPGPQLADYPARLSLMAPLSYVHGHRVHRHHHVVSPEETAHHSGETACFAVRNCLLVAQSSMLGHRRREVLFYRSKILATSSACPKWLENRGRLYGCDNRHRGCVCATPIDKCRKSKQRRAVFLIVAERYLIILCIYMLNMFSADHELCRLDLLDAL